MRISPLRSAIFYLLLGGLFTYIAIQSVEDTVLNFVTIMLATFATIDFVLAIRLIKLHRHIQQEQKKKR